MEMTKIVKVPNPHSRNDVRGTKRRAAAKTGDNTMSTPKIKSWLAYWRSANMVDIDQIRAFDQVATARRFCACMREGVFLNVTDLQIWRALTEMRK
jgi:hypothetical protein